MPASQFYSCSSRLSKAELGEERREGEKLAFTAAYINADEESRVLKSVRKGMGELRHPDKM